MEKPVIIFGASGLGAVVLDIMQSHDIVVYGFLDDNEELHGQEIGHIPILGKTDDHGYLKLIGQKCEAFLAIDETEYKKELVTLLNKQRKVMPMNALHSQSFISSSASLGHGNLIAPQVVVHSQVEIGNHCILHANCTVEYETILGDFVQVGAGSIINAKVEIGNEVFIGSGVTIVSGVKIGTQARIGAGSVVVKDVEEGDTVFGNPAVSIE